LVPNREIAHSHIVHDSGLLYESYCMKTGTMYIGTHCPAFANEHNLRMPICEWTFNLMPVCFATFVSKPTTTSHDY